MIYREKVHPPTIECYVDDELNFDDMHFNDTMDRKMKEERQEKKARDEAYRVREHAKTGIR
eukprot:15570702-Heterocapsa_arctica.AAC.1